MFNGLIALNLVDAARMVQTYVLGFQINIGSKSGVLDSVVSPSNAFLIIYLLNWFGLSLFVVAALVCSPGAEIPMR